MLHMVYEDVYPGEGFAQTSQYTVILSLEGALEGALGGEEKTFAVYRLTETGSIYRSTNSS